MKTRKPLKITSRNSSITNAFVQAIIPYTQPSPEDVALALSNLGMSLETMVCVYCGDKCTDWDHLFPLVKNKRPSGYFSNIENMVPACGPCNQSKGGQNWEKWMLGQAKNSPSTRKIFELRQSYQQNNTIHEVIGGEIQRSRNLCRPKGVKCILGKARRYSSSHV